MELLERYCIDIVNLFISGLNQGTRKQKGKLLTLVDITDFYWQ